MTTSTEPRRPLSARCVSASIRTSSSSGTPRAAPRRCTRCCAATRRSSCRTSRSRSSSRATASLRRALGRARFEQTGRRAETLEEYLALFAAARADQRVGEASTFYLWSRAAAGADRRSASRTRGSSRSCASRRASCARCTCRWCRTTRETEKRPAQGARARGRAARGTQDPAQRPLAAGADLLRPRALRRAAAPLPRGVRRASRCWC